MFVVCLCLFSMFCVIISCLRWTMAICQICRTMSVTFAVAADAEELCFQTTLVEMWRTSHSTCEYWQLFQPNIWHLTNSWQRFWWIQLDWTLSSRCFIFSIELGWFNWLNTEQPVWMFCFIQTSEVLLKLNKYSHSSFDKHHMHHSQI